MSAWGKVIGATVGLLSGGPVGAVVGLVVGHSVDASLPQFTRAADLARTQNVFFEAVFRLLGHVAKVDGRVSEREVAAVEALIERLQLDAAARRRAIQCFNGGKRASFRIAPVLAELDSQTRGHEQLRRLAVEMILDTALADGRLKPEGRAVVERVARTLGVTEAELRAMMALRGSASAGPSPYETLGVARGATMAEVKIAYRRQMGKHHPDKLVSRGLPPEMLEVAAEKTREIRAAYDQIRRERGM